MQKLADFLRRYDEYIALGGLAFLAAAFLRYVLGGEFNIYVQALLGVGVILLLIYALGRPEELFGAITGRRARYGSNALLMTVAFLGILVLVNFLGSRYEKRLDWTQDKSYTISEQTRKVMANLDKPIKIIGFYQQGDSRQEQVTDLLKEYRQYTDKLSWEFIDPDVQPAVARQMEITDYGTLIFQSEDRKQSTVGSDEQDLTSAILKVSRAEQKGIYFLSGNGERAVDSSNQDGYGQAKQVLEKDNYQIKTTLLVVTPTVPADCALLVIAGPTKPLLDQEIKAINTYLDKGGKLLYLTDPETTSGLEAGVLSKLGVQVRNDIIIDPASSLLGDVASPLISSFRWSPITKDLKAAAFFPQSRSLLATTQAPEGVTLNPFADTSADSWGETDLVNRQVSFDAAKDAKGPLTVGLSAEVEHKLNGVTTSPTARLVVFGDSDFGSNLFLSTGGNRDLFANAVNWLTEEESLISIRAKAPTDRSMFMTNSEQILSLITSVVLLPLGVLMAGAIVWWRRR